MVTWGGDINRQSKLVKGLQSSACYPHKVDYIEVIETHISWVLLTGDYAYKIKKNVNFGFVDFSSIEKRKYFCEEELRLNKRFSNSIYLDVVPITDESGSLVVNGRGKAVEYAVFMRQFEKGQLLSELAVRDALEDHVFFDIARLLADFHRVWPKSKLSLEKCMRAVSGFTVNNFVTIRENKIDSDMEDRCLANVEHWTTASINTVVDLFRHRYANGMIKECHGDLHLGNITLIHGEPVFFDCIEFNPELANIDTMSELAFLLMDLDWLGRKADSVELLNHYLVESGDYVGLTVLNFYKTYRAMVRAKVLKLRIAQNGMPKNERNDLYEDYMQYLYLADSYTAPKENTLIITYGLSGSGKTTRSRVISRDIQAVHIRSDVERKRLFGMRPEEKSGSSIAAGIYSESVNEQTYCKLYSLADMSLQGGFNTIVDATFLNRTYRERFRKLAEKHAAKFNILQCQASSTELNDRLERRSAKKQTISEAGIEVLARQKENMDLLTQSEKKCLMGSYEI